MGVEEIPQLPPELWELEPMPEPWVPARTRIALVVSVVVVAAGAFSCITMVSSLLPPPDATAEGAQATVEEFVLAAANRDKPTMRSLLTAEARRSMDDTVLEAVADRVATGVGTPGGFQRIDQEITGRGRSQRIYLSLAAGGSNGRVRVRSTLVYDDGHWLIEKIEIR